MRNAVKWNVLVLVGIMVLGLAGSASAGLFGNKFEEEVAIEASAMKLYNEVQRGDYGLVDTATLKAWQDAGKKMVIVDAMPYEASYKKNHIPGAVPFEFPIPDMDAWDTTKTAGKTQQDYAKLLGPDKDVTVVVYCGFVKCTRSHNGAVWAKKLGYTNVYRHPGGIFAWKGKDYPIGTVD